MIVLAIICLSLAAIIGLGSLTETKKKEKEQVLKVAKLFIGLSLIFIGFSLI